MADTTMDLKQVALWIDNLIDLETAVDDARAHVDRALNELLACERERDRAAAHLAHLIASDLDLRGETE